jgi:sugar phosphate isomerase/epimerase
MTIKLGCHLWSFGQCTVAEAAGIIRALGLEYMDLGNAKDLDPVYIAGNIASEAERFNRLRRETGLTFVDAFPHVLPTFSLNHPDPEFHAGHRRVMAAFFDFAVRIGLSGVTVSPGRYWPGSTPQADFDRGAEALRWLLAEAAQRGLPLRIEPHIESVCYTPALTLAMLAAVPGLTLTLDYSHFVFHGAPLDQIAVLDQHATHFHARQAALSQPNCNFAQGTIDFAAIVRRLQARGYDGGLCLEYVHGPWAGMDKIDCVTETILLRDHLRSLLD